MASHRLERASGSGADFVDLTEFSWFSTDQRAVQIDEDVVRRFLARSMLLIAIEGMEQGTNQVRILRTILLVALLFISVTVLLVFLARATERNSSSSAARGSPGVTIYSTVSIAS